jgi:NAD(P)-dependent dehydrogenase (short-subunit alcohol dehydrogenase family)
MPGACPHHPHVAVVTGAGSGIGRAVALPAEGTSRWRAGGQASREQALAGAGDRALAVPTDAHWPDAVGTCSPVSATPGRWTCCSTTPAPAPAPFEDLSYKRWRQSTST